MYAGLRDFWGLVHLEDAGSPTRPEKGGASTEIVLRPGELGLVFLFFVLIIGLFWGNLLAKVGRVIDTRGGASQGRFGLTALGLVRPIELSFEKRVYNIVLTRGG